ncbi:hypothetical protein LINGRAHAP2_LOCUS32796, partial [Linum grandiflorum]
FIFPFALALLSLSPKTSLAPLHSKSSFPQIHTNPGKNILPNPSSMADSVHPIPSPSASASAAAPSKSVKANLPSSSTAAHYSPLLCKLFLFLLLLLAIPLLPSQAPDLFNQSFLTNLWELSQLLFIGLAVSYGLFSRRNAEPDDHFAADNTSQFTVDESQSSFVSRIFQVSPLFEDSYEVPSECQDKTAVHLSAASYGYTVPDPVAYDAYGNHQSVSVKNGFQISDDSGGDEVIQAWNAQYFQGQSTVVVAKPNLDVLGQCEMEEAQKPLGLPVRSLNSSGTDFNMPDFSNNISKVAAQSKENDGGAYGSGEEFFGDVSPVNLEAKFNRTVDYSDFSWRRAETGVAAAVDRSGHLRPVSVDETQFESLKSGSFFGSSKASVDRSGHSRPVSVGETQFESLKSGSFFGSSNTASGDRSGHSRPVLVDETQFESLKSGSFFGSSNTASGDRSGHSRPVSVDDTQFESLKSGSFFGSSKASGDRSGHSRPVSVDETQFESLKSESFFGSSNTASVDRSGHLQPLSVDETQFESLKSESFFGSSRPATSSEDGVMQHSATTQFHKKSNSLPSEFPNEDMDESGVSNPAVIPPPPARVTGGSRMNAFHLRKYSGNGSLFKKESQGNSRGVLKEKDLESSRDPLKGLSENKGDEDSEKKKKKKSQPSLKLDAISENELLAKPPSRRGKSVRTVRSPGGGSSTTEAKRDAAVAMAHSYLDDVVGKAFDEIESKKKNHVAKIPKPSSAEYKKRDRQRSSSNHDDRVGKTYDETVAESKKRSDGRKSTSRVSDEQEESKKDRIRVSVDEEAVVDRRGDVDEHDLDEVDRKADEFIAKFREQIMLQKVASIERSSRKRGVVKDGR